VPSSMPADRARRRALLLLCAAQFLIMIDLSVVGVALPRVQQAFALTPETLSWVVNAYAIAFGGLLLLGGRLADLLGARRVFAAGLVTLTAGTLAAGAAAGAPALVAARAVQGAGAALAAPAALALILDLFARRPRELGGALALWGAAAAAGGTAGVVLGGVLTDLLGWRWVFLATVPVGLAVLAAGGRLPPTASRRAARPDVAGSLAVTAGLALAVFGLVRAEQAGWGAPSTVAALAAGAVLLGAFAALQKRRADPLVPARLLRAPQLVAGNVLMLLLGAAWTPAWFFLNLYLQQVLGYSPLQAGLAALPMTALTMALMIAGTARVVERRGLRPTITAGLALLTVALGLLALARPDGHFLVHVLPASLLAGLGMALSFAPAAMAATGSAGPDEQGLASGLVNTSQQVGSALGLAALTALAAAAGAELTAALAAAFLGAAGIAALGAVAAPIMLRSRASGRHGSPPPRAAPHGAATPADGRTSSPATISGQARG